MSLTKSNLEPKLHVFVIFMKLSMLSFSVTEHTLLSLIPKLKCGVVTIVLHVPKAVLLVVQYILSSMDIICFCVLSYPTCFRPTDHCGCGLKETTELQGL
jgi:hypothetical protein